jgi:hypothetical protein
MNERTCLIFILFLTLCIKLVVILPESVRKSESPSVPEYSLWFKDNTGQEYDIWSWKYLSHKIDERLDTNHLNEDKSICQTILIIDGLVISSTLLTILSFAFVIANQRRYIRLLMLSVLFIETAVVLVIFIRLVKNTELHLSFSLAGIGFCTWVFSSILVVISASFPYSSLPPQISKDMERGSPQD